MRLKGKVPAVLYGKKCELQNLLVEASDLLRVTATKAGLNVLVDLKVSGGKPTTVLIRDYQAHPIDRHFTHVDFQAIDVSERLSVEIPIILVGQAIGVKEGGILEQLLRKVEVRCLATQIPENIEINVEHLNIGDSIHSSDISLPKGVELARAMNYTIATVVPPAKEEVPAVAAAVPVEGAPAEGAAAPATVEGAAAPTGPKAEGAEKGKGAVPKAEGAEKGKSAAPKAAGAEKGKK